MKIPTQDEQDVAERVPDLSWIWASMARVAKVSRSVRSRFAARTRARVFEDQAMSAALAQVVAQAQGYRPAIGKAAKERRKKGGKHEPVSPPVRAHAH
jgi:hypothetical protein